MNMPSPINAQQQTDKPGRMALPTRIALCVFLAIAAIFLLTEHWAHVWPFLPYLLFLACPVMHLFHHHGHGGPNMSKDMSKDTSAGHAQTTETDVSRGHH